MVLHYIPLTELAGLHSCKQEPSRASTLSSMFWHMSTVSTYIKDGSCTAFWIPFPQLTDAVACGRFGKVLWEHKRIEGEAVTTPITIWETQLFPQNVLKREARLNRYSLFAWSQISSGGPEKELPSTSRDPVVI